MLAVATFLPNTTRWYCVDHADEAVAYLESFREEVEALAERAQSETFDPGQRNAARRATTPDRLADVATAYRLGGARQVMSTLRIGRSQAFRLISLARMAKLIDDR